MTTQQQIDDPGQWRAGDDVRIEWLDGSAVTGKAEKIEDGQLAVRIGNRSATYILDWPGLDRTVTVTRTVEPIPEPTVPWALVKFADGAVAARLFVETGVPWDSVDGPDDWATYVENHGAPVAVSLPHWSDEVDGLRAGVQRELERVDTQMRTTKDPVQGALWTVRDRLRALLAEGREA